MATKKITITLDEETLAQVHKMVASGQSKSMSSFVQHAVAVSLDDVTGWGAMLSRSLTETGGPLTTAEREWADGVLGIDAHQSQSAA